MHSTKPNLAIIFILTVITGCTSTYYNTLEKVGIHKRDILLDRIEDAQEAQMDGKEQFADALELFTSVVNVVGGELKKRYDSLKSEYDDAEEAAEEISERIEKVDDVATDLFNEWQKELEQYSNEKLKRDSTAKLTETKREYAKLLRAMRKAENSLQPVLNTLRDNVLYLKHNLNARAIASIKGELTTINKDVASMNQAMQQAIDESNAFISRLREDT
jgi:chromosome segregation ATPase